MRRQMKPGAQSRPVPQAYADEETEGPLDNSSRGRLEPIAYTYRTEAI